MWRHNAYLLGQSGYLKKMKNVGNKMQTTQWLKWRHNAYLLAKYGCKNKEQENKSTLLQYQIFLCKLTRRHTQETLKGGLQSFRRVGGKMIWCPNLEMPFGGLWGLLPS
jgi:hypothetical protein